jgi:hypothetical protein
LKTLFDQINLKKDFFFLKLINFVHMLFSVTEFEQSFNNNNLKKALRLVREERISLHERLPNGSYHFLIDNQFDLHLKKRGGKILSYTCFCYEQAFCPHLAAALFYFQKDILGITSNKKANRFKAEPLKTSAAGSFSNQSAADYFHKSPGNEFFLLCLARVQHLLAPYLQLDRLNQKHINSLNLKLAGLLDSDTMPSEPDTHFLKSEDENRNRTGSFSVNLAIVCSMPLIFNLRMLGDESVLLGVFENSLKKLDDFYQGGIVTIEQQNWLGALLLAGKIKNRVGGQAFDFLLPRALSFIRKDTDFERLETLAGGRRTKTNFTMELDKPAISRMQIGIARKKPALFERGITHTPEYVIARAELLFCTSKPEKAFSVLEAAVEKVKTEFPRLLQAYLDYLMLRAREYQQSAIELKYLKESMVYGLYINPSHLDRFFELLPVDTRSPEIDNLVLRITQHSGDQAFDKIPALLLRDGRPDALLSLIKKQENKFKLLHTIALQKFPVFDNEFLLLYQKHLFAALTGAPNERCHEQVFIKAKEYLDRLPQQTRDELVSNLLRQLGPFSAVGKYISRNFSEKVPVETLPAKKRGMKQR